MCEPEFELVERCAKEARLAFHARPVWHGVVVAVLRESGHAELVAALKGLEPYWDAIVCYASTMGEYEPNRLVVNARGALRKAKGETHAK